MRITTNRTNYLTDKQIETIFKEKMKPILNNEITDRYNNLNQLRKTPTINIAMDKHTKKLVVNINEFNYNNNELIIFDNDFFNQQTRSMAIAKANDVTWTNIRLLNEFKKGMRIELNKILNK